MSGQSHIYNAGPPLKVSWNNRLDELVKSRDKLAGYLAWAKDQNNNQTDPLFHSRLLMVLMSLESQMLELHGMGKHLLSVDTKDKRLPEITEAVQAMNTALFQLHLIEEYGDV